MNTNPVSSSLRWRLQCWIQVRTVTHPENADICVCHNNKPKHTFSQTERVRMRRLGLRLPHWVFRSTSGFPQQAFCPPPRSRESASNGKISSNTLFHDIFKILFYWHNLPNSLATWPARGKHGIVSGVGPRGGEGLLVTSDSKPQDLPKLFLRIYITRFSV